MISTSLRTVKGIGIKTEALFGRLGITSTEELLCYYPRDYDSYENPILVSEVVPGKKNTIIGKITRNIGIHNTGKNTVVTTILQLGASQLELIWFHMPFLRSTLKRGETYLFRGIVIDKKGKLVMEHPEIFTKEDYVPLLHTLQPIYSLTAGLSNKLIVKTIRTVLGSLPTTPDYLPLELRERYHLVEYTTALLQIHFPQNKEAMLIARHRLVFDEFLLFILGIQQLKEQIEETKNAFPMKKVWETEQLIETLPYTLTHAQQQVWMEIEQDMTSHTLMSRLIQGDVGSGKTIVAFLSMLMAAANGYQSALMVPTEVLAKQHFLKLTALLEEQGLTQYHPVLLTGSLRKKEKQEIYEQIQNGTTLLIIGTHALIQEKVNYHNLALVITDEQHRFGVKQRELFSNKGENPHVLVMSATPIPRTLAIIIYGDLTISVIDELPAKRLPIKNCVVDISYRPTAYTFIKKEVECGHQAYIICPMVEESEELEGENVIDYTARLRRIFPKEINIQFLHGRMKAEEKNAIMEDFTENKIQILVSTTVIEVGVDVPNAVVMMVENAERFGLAQLHQLRGRVGRGEEQSYCIFMQGNATPETKKRLEILVSSNDGFFIAGEDLKLRGPGDLFGIRQSGLLEFQIGDIFQDTPILQEASQAASALLQQDADLASEQQQGLKIRLQEYMKYQVGVV